MPPRKKKESSAADVPAPVKELVADSVPATSFCVANAAFLERHVVVGDLHLRRTDPLGVIGLDGLNTRLRDKLNALDYAVAYAVNHRATHVDILGDVFDAVNPPENLKRLFWTALRPAIDAGMYVTILIGNHDTTGEFANFAGDALIVSNKIKIVDKHGWVTLNPAISSKVLYLPYLKREKLVQEYKQICAVHGTPSVIFGHFEIEGAELAPDNCVIREGLDRAMFNDVPLVWLGHIHKHQEFRPGMAYIGSSIKCDFGEVGNKKVFGVLDITGDAVIPFRMGYIDIPQRPMFNISIMESNPDNLYLAEKLPANICAQGVLLKFVLEGSKEWVDSLDKVKFKRRFPNAIRVKFETKYWDTDRPPTEVVTSNMVDRVHALVKAKGKSQAFLDAGLAIAAKAQEIEL